MCRWCRLMMILIVCLWGRGGIVHFKRHDNGLITLWKKYNLLSAEPLRVHLTPPKPITFDNHTHFSLSGTNGTRQSKKKLKVREEIPKWRIKQETATAYWGIHFFGCLEMKRHDLERKLWETFSILSHAIITLLPWPCQDQQGGRVHRWLTSPTGQLSLIGVPA